MLFLVYPETGFLIYVVGAPMAGFFLQFKRNYNPALIKESLMMIRLGEVFFKSVINIFLEFKEEIVARDNLEKLAERVPFLRVS